MAGRESRWKASRGAGPQGIEGEGIYEAQRRGHMGGRLRDRYFPP